MKITVFTKPKGLITIASALILVADPDLILHLLGTELGTAGGMMARILGGAYLASGIGLTVPPTSVPGTLGFTP